MNWRLYPACLLRSIRRPAETEGLGDIDEEKGEEETVSSPPVDAAGWNKRANAGWRMLTRRRSKERARVFGEHINKGVSVWCVGDIGGRDRRDDVGGHYDYYGCAALVARLGGVVSGGVRA